MGKWKREIKFLKKETRARARCDLLERAADP